MGPDLPPNRLHLPRRGPRRRARLSGGRTSGSAGSATPSHRLVRRWVWRNGSSWSGRSRSWPFPWTHEDRFPGQQCHSVIRGHSKPCAFPRSCAPRTPSMRCGRLCGRGLV